MRFVDGVEGRSEVGEERGQPGADARGSQNGRDGYEEEDGEQGGSKSGERGGVRQDVREVGEEARPAACLL